MGYERRKNPPYTMPTLGLPLVSREILFAMVIYAFIMTMAEKLFVYRPPRGCRYGFVKNSPSALALFGLRLGGRVLLIPFHVLTSFLF
jgi:hypothetical protein